MIGPVSYTVGHVDGDKLRPNAASDNVGAHGGSAEECWAPRFYERLNRVLDDAGFDAFVEAQCASFYADGVGRPSLAPGRYFRLLLLGYFEGLDSERAIAWRAADSLSIRTFLDFALHEAPPDHSTLSRTRRLIDLETHQAVFYLGVAATGRRHAGRGAHGGHRCHDAGSQCRDAEHCAAGYGRELRRISDPAGRGVRPLDADARRVGPVRPHPQKEGLRTRTGPTRTIWTRRSPRLRTAARIWRTPPSMRSTWKQAPSWA